MLVLAVGRSNCLDIRSRCKPDATDEDKYLVLLEVIGQHEKLPLKAEEVRDCLIMLNELICLYDTPQAMQIEHH